jgi:hypothetical protein
MSNVLKNGKLKYFLSENYSYNVKSSQIVLNIGNVPTNIDNLEITHWLKKRKLVVYSERRHCQSQKQ